MKDPATDVGYLGQQLERLSLEGGLSEPVAIRHAVARRNAFVIGATDLVRPDIGRVDAQTKLTDVARGLHQIDGQAFVDSMMSVDLSWCPDLEAWRVKLGVTLERRAEYAAANDSPDVDEAIFDPVWGLAICPARDAAQVEDQFFREVGEIAIHTAKRTLAALRRDHAFVAARHEPFLWRVVAVAELQRERRRVGRRRWSRMIAAFLLAMVLSAILVWVNFDHGG